MAMDYDWSTMVTEKYVYLHFSDKPPCCSLHSFCLLINGDLLVVDIVVSTFAADIYMLPPVLWVPLDFLHDVVI
jgi:hypothetical protein